MGCHANLAAQSCHRLMHASLAAPLLLPCILLFSKVYFVPFDHDCYVSHAQSSLSRSFAVELLTFYIYQRFTTKPLAFIPRLRIKDYFLP
jgi:hypothetical protein